MTPASRLSGDEVLDTFLDIVLGDDELLAAEFADIVDGLIGGQPPETRSAESPRGSGLTDDIRRWPRNRGDSRRGVPVPVVGGRGVRSPPARSLICHPPDQ